MKNSRPSRTVELPVRFREHRQSTAAAAAAAAAVRRRQTQPSKQVMTRGRDGHALSPAVGAACHPSIQPLGQAQTTAAAVDLSANHRQPGALGSELEVDLGLSPGRKKHQQHQQHQYQHQHQQKGADKASSSSSSSSNINSSAARSGRDDELVFDKQGAETRRLQTKVIASATATAAAAAAASRPRSKIPAGSIDKAMDKGYAEWSTVLLRRVCARRRIRGMSSCEERETMAQLLAEQDYSEGRPSPHLDDLEEIVLGITRDAAYRDPKEKFCDMLLPEGARIEYSGTAALADSGDCGKGAAGDGLSSAQRRLLAKRKARELLSKTSQEWKELLKAERVGQAKKTKTAEENKCTSKALSRVLPRLIDRIAPAKTNWLERVREAEAGCTKLAQSVTVYRAHKKFSIEMGELVREGGGGETEGGGGRSSIFRENYLDNVLQKLEARMLKDADADI